MALAVAATAFAFVLVLALAFLGLLLLLLPAEDHRTTIDDLVLAFEDDVGRRAERLIGSPVLDRDVVFAGFVAVPARHLEGKLRPLLNLAIAGIHESDV